MKSEKIGQKYKPFFIVRAEFEMKAGNSQKFREILAQGRKCSSPEPSAEEHESEFQAFLSGKGSGADVAFTASTTAATTAVAATADADADTTTSTVVAPTIHTSTAMVEPATPAQPTRRSSLTGKRSNLSTPSHRIIKSASKIGSASRRSASRRPSGNIGMPLRVTKSSNLGKMPEEESGVLDVDGTIVFNANPEKVTQLPTEMSACCA